MHSRSARWIIIGLRAPDEQFSAGLNNVMSWKDRGNNRQTISRLGQSQRVELATQDAIALRCRTNCSKNEDANLDATSTIGYALSTN